MDKSKIRTMQFLVLITMSLLTSASLAAGTTRPNVIFVLADQWRAQATGYAGDPNVKTPNLDAMEKVSVNFTNAVSSNPVCSPCRASILTGQRSTKHGIFINDAHLSDDAVTLPKILAQNGYDTALIGKWHLNGRGRLSFIPPENRQGFKYWKACECTHAYNHSIYFANNPAPMEWDGYDAIAQTTDARQYIRDRVKAGGPFFLCLWWGPPHNPFNTAPAEFKSMYDLTKIQLRPNVPEVYFDAANKDAAGYYAHISALDSCLGKLRQTIHDAGIEDNTILIFSSDHGEMLFSHGFNRKQRPWDESARVPMLWNLPGSLQPKHIDTPIATEDIMPTILGFCGLAIPSTAQGLDYSGYMKGGDNPNPDDVALLECVSPFAEFNRAIGGREWRGIRTSRYTYVRELKGPWLFYDNQADPYQQKNLVADPEHAKTQATLDALLNEKLAKAGDEFKPADYYLEKWGYKGRLDKNGALPTTP